MTSTQKNNSRVVTHCRGVRGGQATECARDRPPPRQRNICGASGRGKPVCATCDLGHIMTNCRHFGERVRPETTLRKWRVEVRWMSAEMTAKYLQTRGKRTSLDWHSNCLSCRCCSSLSSLTSDSLTSL